MRLYYVVAGASILVLGGRQASTITSLADLVTEDLFRRILQFYWDRSAARRICKGEITEDDLNDPAAGNSGLTENMSKTLLQVAKYWCQVEPSQLKALAALAQAVRRPKQTGITIKNSNCLAQLDDPAKLRELLGLPKTLMDLAESIRDRRPVEAARLAGLAAAIELLLNIPLRLRNLARLRIGINLKYTGARGGLISRTHAFGVGDKEPAELGVVGGQGTRHAPRAIHSELPAYPGGPGKDVGRSRGPVVVPRADRKAADRCRLVGHVTDKGHRRAHRPDHQSPPVPQFGCETSVRGRSRRPGGPASSAWR